MKKNHNGHYGFKMAMGLVCMAEVSSFCAPGDADIRFADASFAVLGEVEKINTLGTTILFR